MAKIEDALPNETVTDEAFVEQEVTVPEDTVSSEGVEVTMDEEGGAQIDFDPKAEGLESQDHFSNLAEIMEDKYLGELGSTLFDQYTEYKESRADWENTYREGLELLGFKYEKEQNLLEEQVVLTILFLLKRLHNFKRKLTKNYYQLMVQYVHKF